VARTVFKIAEAVARRLVGSIPTRSRQVKTLPPLSDFALFYAGLRRALPFTTPFATQNWSGLGAADVAKKAFPVEDRVDAGCKIVTPLAKLER
jgi:hypothetical protein